MAERRIRKIGDPILRQECAPVRDITPGVIKLLDDLRKTLYAAEGRAGLAAPQIGIPKRVAVLDVGEGLVELINPRILERKGVQVGPEACLSIPGFAGRVKRAKYVRVLTWDRTGKERVIEGRGELARCLQHEIDHLDGILYIDHVKDGELYDTRTNRPVDALEMIRLSRLHRM